MREKISSPGLRAATYAYIVGRTMLAAAVLPPAVAACTGNQDESPPPPTPRPHVVADPNPEFINCGALTHLEIDEGGRVLVIEGTESTVGLRAEGGLEVDIGNDGTAEHTLAVGEETSLQFGDDSTVDMIWNDNQWISLTRQC